MNTDDDIWADYDTEGERNSWFYGNPGDENYVDPATISEEDLQVLEEQWELDLWVQKKRGWIQGWFRGFYKDYDWEL